jgi:hypothetical protein
LASLKGAPGVTTLACLLAAGWPPGRRVVLVEGDPSGGDLAARFSLSAAIGWPTMAAAAAHRGAGVSQLDPHVQTLPGGVAVVTGTRSAGARGDEGAARRAVAELVANVSRDLDVVVDLGRLLPGIAGSDELLARLDYLAIVIRADAPGVLRLADRAGEIRLACPADLAAVTVGSRGYGPEEIEACTGVPVVSAIPWDGAAAAIVTGDDHRRRRLARSSLGPAVRSLVSVVLGSHGTPTGPEGFPSTQPPVVVGSRGGVGGAEWPDGRLARSLAHELTR